jgi:hypothetical protein
MAVLDYITLRAPEYSTYPGIEGYIGVAASMTGSFDNVKVIDLGDGKTTTRFEIAIALRTLHMISRRETRDNSGGKGQTVGFITSEREGEISVGTEVPAVDQKRFGDLVNTVWGIELIELIKSSFFLPRVRTMPCYAPPSLQSSP